ncbi:transposase [Oscillatoriales cyanobacterium LEGE 11467]|uniref:Transposase n=1 Tax=Zarconia navalis LEGE 11467 TaxID=1828826 RepID=A0A928VXL4_9CYAN|nr:transposase [Zarconia navalis]MBE9041976.1 transposase [Zarconia navalis LEGE 11467]
MRYNKNTLIQEFKVKAKPFQFAAIDEAIRTAQFVQNKALRYWMDNALVNKFDLNKLCAVLAKEFSFAGELNSMARQASAERAWSAISRFYDNCKKRIKPVGYPKFKKFARSVEYKTSGWKLTGTKRIVFTDKKGIGQLKLVGTHDLGYYPVELIKRVRLIRRADGYYCQFCIQVNRREPLEATGRTVGLDVGLESFYTDSNGRKENNPRFYRKSQAKRRTLQRRLARTKKGSNNRKKAINTLARLDLKTSRQRKDHVVKLARCVVQSNDLVAYEDLRIKNMVRNHNLAKSITDAGWYQFRQWLERYGQVFGRVTVAVNPAYTSQECFSCGQIVKKSLSTRTHACACGTQLDRDENAALNILRAGLVAVGHTGTSLHDRGNASGEMTATYLGFSSGGQVTSQKEESPLP